MRISKSNSQAFTKALLKGFFFGWLFVVLLLELIWPKRLFIEVQESKIQSCNFTKRQSCNKAQKRVGDTVTYCNDYCTVDSGSSSPGSTPDQGHCVVFLDKIPYFHGASLHSSV